MARRLHRYYGAGYSHFITTSCYRRLPLLGNARNRDLFLSVLELVRRRCRFVVGGYVVMPEHVHLLISEPPHGDPSVVMKALKRGRGFVSRSTGGRSKSLGVGSIVPALAKSARAGHPQYWRLSRFKGRITRQFSTLWFG